MAEQSKFRERVKGSRFARLAVFPSRARRVGLYDARVFGWSASWLFTSRENQNFTYDLTPTNQEHLAWFVSNLTHLPIVRVRALIDEIESDSALREHVAAAIPTGPHPGLADRVVRYGRRLGWYALVRALRPAHVVETGTDKGLGSCILASALIRNGSGRLTTIDVDSAAGYLITKPYDSVTTLYFGDSVTTLADMPAASVDLFLHDSDHSAAHERAELESVAPRLTDNAWVLSDNAHATPELANWAEANGRTFAFFDERPAGHWYPGDGIGVSPPQGWD